ncbi:MAG: divalent-cation tolerance protein CutA [Candidatus Micrarchaeota archaeon]
MPPLTVYSTCASRKEAEKIASALVRERLAACVNFFPCSSVFKWRGRQVKAREFVLLAKTTERKYPALERRLKRLNSYEVPCIVAWKDSAAYRPYSAWVERSCQ